MIAVVSEPYTTLTCDSVPKYHTSPWRMISQRMPAVAPPISAWLIESRPTGMK